MSDGVRKPGGWGAEVERWERESWRYWRWSLGGRPGLRCGRRGELLGWEWTALDLRNQGGLKSGHWTGCWSQEIVAVIQDLGQSR